MGTLDDIRKDPPSHDEEPKCDIAICSQCGWRGPVTDCETDEEGDYESGYILVHVCPKCEDGGLIEDYVMSKKRAREWYKWNAKWNRRRA